MESKSMRATLVIVSCMLILLLGLGSADECYDECFRVCTRDGGSPWICKYSCEALCYSTSVSQVDPSCSLPCVTSSCRDLQPEKKGMEACVGTCFKKCARQTP